MTILLPTLAVAFAAFCVWLTVRIVNRKERWAKWTLAGVVGVPVFYGASFGPACWLNERGYLRETAMIDVYGPVLNCTTNGRLPAVIAWYASLGSRGAEPVVEFGKIKWDGPHHCKSGLKTFVPNP